MSKGYKELLRRAKEMKVSNIEELEDLVHDCRETITGADFECVRKELKLKRF